MSAASKPLPNPRILMGPGPCSIPARVVEAVGRAPLGHLDPELFERDGVGIRIGLAPRRSCDQSHDGQDAEQEP